MSCPISCLVRHVSRKVFSLCMHVNRFFLSHSWPSHGPTVILDMRWLALSGVPVPQVVEEILEVIKVIPQEWVSERIDCRCASAAVHGRNRGDCCW